MKKTTILKIEFEISQIDKLLADTEPLIKLAKNKTPDRIESAALALFLHSFYGGIENLMKLYFKDRFGKLPTKKDWHKELLNSCFDDFNQRALFNEDLRDTLEDYLKFRHFIRTNYNYKIKWEKMEHLVININDVWELIKKTLISYITYLSF